MQSIKALEEAELKLKRTYERRDSEAFNKVKSFMLKIQKQLDSIIK